MSDSDSPEIPQEVEKTPQEELVELWKRPESWWEGKDRQIKGLPPGMRLIELFQEDVCILRGRIPGIPQAGDERPNDVPLTVFSTEGIQTEDVIKEAKKFQDLAVRGQIEYQGQTNSLNTISNN